MTEQVYGLEMYEGHLLVTINKIICLVDTGAPNSIGNQENLVIMSNSFNLQKLYCGVDLNTLNEYVGIKFDVLLGMDIMSEFDLSFTRNNLTFKSKKSHKFQTPIVAKSISGIPLVSIFVGKNPLSVFFDTGAKISYMKKIFLSQGQLGIKDDFHPFVGKFKARIHLGEFKIGECEIKFESGFVEDLPQQIQQTLKLGGCEGILGTEILDNFTIFLKQMKSTANVGGIEENFETFIEGKEYNSKTKTNIMNDFVETTEKKKKKSEKKLNTFDLMKFISSQPKEPSTIEELEKQRKYLQKIRKEIVTDEYSKVQNTVEFFEKNLSYFVHHPLEFQRLVGQLDTNERKIFTHTIFTYYYADVLIQLKQQDFQKSDTEMFDSLEDDDKSTEFLKKSYFYSYTREKIEFDHKKVSQAYHYILENLEKLKEDSNLFYNLMIQLNSHETIMLEDLLFRSK